MLYTGSSCCDSGNHPEPGTLDIETWIPPYCKHNNVTGIDSGSEAQQGVTGNNTRAVYRPISERKKLEGLLLSWRAKIYAEDPVTAIFPIEDILSSNSITLISRLPADSNVVSSTSGLISFLEQSKDWGLRYAPQVLQIISDFNLATPVKPKRKAQAIEQPCFNKLDFRQPKPKKRKANDLTNVSQGSSSTNSRDPLADITSNNRL